MTSLILMAIIAGGVLGIWIYRRRRQIPTATLTPEVASSATLAFESFTRGNSCLAEGKFAEATAAFHRALELDPKRPHVADRLAEVERRQQAAGATPPVSKAS
jgi:Tfp pilus assembly protein PilF